MTDILTREELIADCAEKFPEQCEALLEVLLPFYDWKLELAPVLPELEARIKKAMYWEDVKRVRVFRADQINEIKISGCDSLLDSIFQPVLDDFALRFNINNIDPLIDFMRELNFDGLNEACACIESDLVRHLITRSIVLLSMLFLGYYIVGEYEKADCFRRLLELCRKGNCLLGHDFEGDVAVITAALS